MTIGSDSCTKNLGGLHSIALLRPEWILALEYSPERGGYTQMELAEGCESIPLLFGEGGGCWSESANASGEVTHRLECKLRGAQPAALETLGKVARNGVVAVVTTLAGERYVVGYSPRAAAAYPLRPLLTESNSGSSRKEGASTRLVLTSTDGWYSHPLVK